MINPIQVMQMLRGGGNPQQMVMQMLGNQAANNPMLQNVLQMMQKGNYGGIEEMARNLAKEKGIDADKAFSQLSQQFGLK